MAEPITFKCSNCQHVLKIGAEKAGRKARCPKCDQSLTVPNPNIAEKPPQKAEVEEATGYGLMDEPETTAPKVDLTVPFRREGDKDEDEDEDDEDRPKKPGGAPKVQKRDKAIKKRTLLEPEKWQPVKLGLKIMGAGFGIWIFAQILHLIPFFITIPQALIPPLVGNNEGALKPQYAAIVTRYEANKNDPQSSEHLNKAAFAVGLITGKDFLDAGLWIFRIAEIFMLLAILTFLVGYGIALSIPNRFGSKGLLIALLSVGGLNLIAQLIFRLLPLAGAMDFTLLMYATPELPMITGNIERIMPLQAFWSAAPFWEILLALVLQLLSFMEPVLFACFLRAIALAMKSYALDGLTRAMVSLAVSLLFIQVTYFLVASSGNSEVIVNVLRVVYVLGQSFQLGQMIWFMLVAFRVPVLIDKELD